MKHLTILTLTLTLAGADAAQADQPVAEMPSLYGSQPISMRCPTEGTVCVTQTHTTAYLIFWGSTWSAGDPIVQAEQILLEEIPSSKWLSLLAPYGVTGASYGGSYFDPTSPPATVTLDEVADEAAKAAAYYGASGATSQNQFIILPQAGSDITAVDTGCGEHWGPIAAANDRTYVTSVIAPFNDSAHPYCTYDYSTNDGVRQPPDLVQATTSITSHEFAETAVDPSPGGSGWADTTDHTIEIADPCSWYSSTPADMTVNVTYLWNGQSCTNAPSPDPGASPMTPPPIVSPHPNLPTPDMHIGGGSVTLHPHHPRRRQVRHLHHRRVIQ